MAIATFAFHHQQSTLFVLHSFCLLHKAQTWSRIMPVAVEATLRDAAAINSGDASQCNSPSKSKMKMEEEIKQPKTEKTKSKQSPPAPLWREKVIARHREKNVNNSQAELSQIGNGAIQDERNVRQKSDRMIAPERSSLPSKEQLKPRSGAQLIKCFGDAVIDLCSDSDDDGIKVEQVTGKKRRRINEMGVAKNNESYDNNENPYNTLSARKGMPFSFRL